MDNGVRSPIANDRQIRELLAAFRQACESWDRAALRESLLPDPSAVVFDIDGHCYRSAQQWTARPPAADPALAGEPDIVLHERVGWAIYQSDESGRTTLVLTRSDGGWHIAHVHRSRATPGTPPAEI